MYRVNLTKFSGPLDLLLGLIEEEKLAINEISLAQVTDQFLDYVKRLEVRLGDLRADQEKSFEFQRAVADFLVVAARLILIKSRSLLPSLVLTGEEEADIKDLEGRLAAYKKIKDLAHKLGQFAKSRNRIFGRELYRGVQVVFFPPKTASIAMLAASYEAVIKTLPQFSKLEEDSVKRVLTLEEKIKELSARIASTIESSFAQVTAGAKNRLEIILAFLAILTLFRKQVLEVSQNEPFGEIKIKTIDTNMRMDTNDTKNTN